MGEVCPKSFVAPYWESEMIGYTEPETTRSAKTLLSKQPSGSPLPGPQSFPSPQLPTELHKSQLTERQIAFKMSDAAIQLSASPAPPAVMDAGVARSPLHSNNFAPPLQTDALIRLATAAPPLFLTSPPLLRIATFPSRVPPLPLPFLLYSSISILASSNHTHFTTSLVKTRK